jgi:hypothetical protein
MFGGQAHVIIAGSVMKKTVCFDSDLDLVLATPTITGTEAERRTLANYLLEEAVFKVCLLIRGISPP